MILALLAILTACVPAGAATITALQTGNWEATGTWSGSTVPTSSDVASNGVDYTITVTGSTAACSQLYLSPTANKTAALAFGNANARLTVSGAVTLGSGSDQQKGQIVMSSGGTLSAGSLAVLSSSSVWTPGLGTVELTANNTLPSFAFTSFNKLTIKGGTTAISTALSVTDTLSIETGAKISIANGVTATVARLTLGGQGTSSGTWGTSGSGATNTDNTYFAATGTGVLKVTVDTRPAANVTTWPTASPISYGSALSNSVLTGGAAAAEGVFAFTTPLLIPQAGTSPQGVTFAAAGYSSATGAVNVTVNKAPLSATASGCSKTYGSPDPALACQIAAGSLVGGDTLTLTRVAGENVGTYAILSNLTNRASYDFTFTGASLTITQKPITVTATAQTKTYGNADPALAYQITVGALVGADLLNGTLTRAAGSNVGAYAIQQGTLGNTNYAITFVGTNLTITRRPVTVTAAAQTKTYGNADPALSYQITAGALVGADVLTGSLTRVAGNNIGSYAIQQGGLSAGSNYTLTFVGNDLTVTKRPITAAADAKTKAYGDADPALTSRITAGSLVSPDTLAGALTRVAGESIGAYAIQQGSLSASGNYTLTFTGDNLTITQKALTVAADAKIKAYGSVDPALTYRITAGALVGIDLLTGSLTRAAGEDLGSYPILQGTLTAGSNYTLAFCSNILTIAEPGSFINLAWDPSPDDRTAGYKLYQGIEHSIYTITNTLPGPVTNTTVTGVTTGTVYYFAVTAYSAQGAESEFSNELIVTNILAGVSTNAAPGGDGSTNAPPEGSITTNADGSVWTNVPGTTGTDTNLPPPPGPDVGTSTNTSDTPPPSSVSSPTNDVQAMIDGIPPTLFMTRNEDETQRRLSFWGTLGADIIVESSSNLASPFAWTAITNLTLTNAAPASGNDQAAAQGTLAAAFVPAIESLIPPADTSNPSVFYRLMMPYSYAVLAGKVLQGKGYQVRLIEISLPGDIAQPVCAHDLCYVNSDEAYIDCHDITFLLALNHSGPTLREVADNWGVYASMNWVTASAFNFVNGTRQLIAETTVVKTQNPTNDPPLTAGQTSAISIDF